MTDNPRKRGAPDNKRVNIGQLHEIRHWSRKFKCTQRELVLLFWYAEAVLPFRMPGAVFDILTSADEHLVAVRKSARKKASAK